MTNAKVVVWLLATVLLTTAYPSEAQQLKKVPRIGYLSSLEPAADAFRSEPFRQALRALGYIEGQNIAIEYRYAEGKRDRLPELAAELVRLKVDIILPAVGQTIRAAKNATKTIPIVMAGPPADPVELGLVESLARPGGNVTGLTSLSRDLAGKRLELFKEAVPKIARVAVLYEAANRLSAIEVKEVLLVAARALAMTIQAWEIRTADGFDETFAALNKQRPDGRYVSGGALNDYSPKTDCRFCVKEPVTVDVFEHTGCR